MLDPFAHASVIPSALLYERRLNYLPDLHWSGLLDFLVKHVDRPSDTISKLIVQIDDARGTTY